MTSVFILFIALGCTALVIDAGRLYLENRSLQRIADSVAFDTAQQAGLCAADGEGDIIGMATAAAARNGFDDVSFTSSGGCDEGGDGNIAALCWITNEGGQWEFADEINGEHLAVQVQTSRTVPASLILGGLFGETVTLTKQAVAKREPIVTFSVGSGLAEINSTESGIMDSMLGGLLNTSLSMGVVTYEGLTTAKVSLADLVEAHPTAGSVTELLENELSVADMMRVFIDAAAAGGESIVGLGGLLTAGADLPPVSLGDILSVTSPTPEAGLDAQVGLFDLISATALFANEKNAVDVSLDDLDITLPGVGEIDANLELYVIEPPQIAIGPPGRDQNDIWRTEAKTAQVRTSVIAQVNTGLPSLAGLASATASVTLGIALDAAGASARAESVACSTYAQQRFDPVTIDADSELASLSLGAFSEGGELETIEDSTSIDLEVCVTLLCVNPSITLQADAATLPGQQGTLEFRNSNEDLPETKRLDGINLGMALTSLSNNLNVTINGLGLLSNLLNPLTNALLSDLLVPLVNGLSVVLEPLLEALGISAAIADVTLIDVDMERVELVR